MNKYFLKHSLITIFIIISVFNVNTVDANNDTKDNVNATHIIDPKTDEVVTTIIPQAYHLELDFLYFRKQIQWIVQNIANGSYTKSGYNQKMILDRLDPITKKIIKGRPSVELNQEELIEKILEHSMTGGRVYVPLKVTESGYDEEEASSLNEVLLASYTTRFNPTRIGRSKNIELSAASINNVIVGSGDIFSFNDTVGPRDVASGYQEAPEYLQGKLVIGIGGGICQTSSTLFNAVDHLGMEIIERHRHTGDVGYVPKGRDATVSFGGLDFIFQNTIGIPVIIKSYYGNGVITVQIKTSKENKFILNNLEDD
ncbi:VanW family protein [Ureibacillus acetophenoni]|uniref:VanW like protein n=1 Tax=Ureibacillus acetophenoni TaxID=614649 RepID=A0A285U5X4_9BACL|nr:VanW family protein [Ureibacillus acetophenoni]SOC37350.1 VanW like protein [Ureibacillus acetophenoni]